MAVLGKGHQRARYKKPQEESSSWVRVAGGHRQSEDETFCTVWCRKGLLQVRDEAWEEN